MALRLQSGEIDCVTFTASSTVENFVGAFGSGEAARLLAGTRVVCIGPITAGTAQTASAGRQPPSASSSGTVNAAPSAALTLSDIVKSPIIRPGRSNRRLMMLGISTFATAIVTPSTTAASGHDVNISWDECRRLLGDDVAEQVRALSIRVYEEGRAWAAARAEPTIAPSATRGTDRLGGRGTGLALDLADQAVRSAEGGFPSASERGRVRR